MEIKEPDTNNMNEILMYCAWLRNVYSLPHRTLHEFNWFVEAMIWGDGSDNKEEQEIYNRYRQIYKQTKHGDPESLLIYARAFLDYCKQVYK